MVPSRFMRLKRPKRRGHDFSCGLACPKGQRNEIVSAWLRGVVVVMWPELTMPEAQTKPSQCRGNRHNRRADFQCRWRVGNKVTDNPGRDREQRGNPQKCHGNLHARDA